MENTVESKQIEPGTPVERERSTLEFPYTDLENAVEVVRGVHNAGGTACEFDELAAHLNAEAKGGGFRLRVNGAKTYGLITYERGGRISLTDLGRQLIDPQTERAARVDAFLSVPLYQKIYDQFKGSLLPPQAGLEKSIESAGVGSKVKEKARQVLLRSAKQAGFFDVSADRLVKPTIRQEVAPARDQAPEKVLDSKSDQPSNGDVVGSGALHPLIHGLLLTIPKTGTEWPSQDRANWLTMASSIFKMIYQDPSGDEIAIHLKKAQGGSTSA